MEIKNLLSELRETLFRFRTERKMYYYPPDLCAVEIAINLVEFSLKRKRLISSEEELWFDATYYLAQSLDGTEWESIYYNYLELVNYVKMHNFFRNEIPNLEW